MSEAAPVDPTPLFEASAAGKLDVVKALVTRGHISANATRPVRVCGGSLACYCLSLSLPNTPCILLWLLQEDGATPIMLAAHHGHEDVVRWLGDNGADIRATTRVRPPTPHRASYTGCHLLIRIHHTTHDGFRMASLCLRWH